METKTQYLSDDSSVSSMESINHTNMIETDIQNLSISSDEVIKEQTSEGELNSAAAEEFKIIFNSKNVAAAVAAANDTSDGKISTKYRTKIQDPDANIIETNISKIDDFLEREITNTRNETWNKLDKGTKIQKLHIFAEKYINDNKLPTKDIRQLKTFFSDCVNKNKLQKAKDVNYDKAAGVIINIPSLAINSTTRNFTLKNLDTKRVSTLKSLTPKRTTAAVTNTV